SARARSTRSGCATPSPGKSRSSRCKACSSPSVTTRTPRCSVISSTSTRTATSSRRRTPPARPSKACSPPATCRTTSSGRRSLPPAPGAWPRWRPSGGWASARTRAPRWRPPPRTTPARTDRNPTPSRWNDRAPRSVGAHCRSVDSADLRKGPAVADDILNLSDATFDETLAGSDTPVLVDFWAEWCGPCKMIAPTLAEIAAEQRGKLVIGKLNVDDNPDTARRFDVMSIPTLLVFKDGQQVKRLVGAKGKGQLLQDLAEFIA